ncbi:MAG TPA: EAL domain-containing response regulator [Steroidobacteraceae bacterium]|nr:EAL domain-containing response regulator [Steroidobacteraceae bacterium]
MSGERNRVVIVADDYQFLDTLTGPSAAIVQEWQVANTLERLAEFLIPAPLAVVIDLEAPGFDPVDALTLLESTRAASKIVLLTGPDLRKLANAKRVAENLSLEIAGTLERPLMMSALSRLLSRHAESRAPITTEELQRGLREHELLLHYQPIFARQAGEWRMRSAEALVRWQHPGRGLLYPGQFLKLAESAGLLGELTDFVFADAMSQAGRWEAQGLDLAVDINLSPGLVRDSGFLERFMRTLKEYEVSPERITLEVIEAASLQDRELVRDVLTRLRLHGVGLSLDDFGTGYSSLTELCRLPFSELKVDRTLIHDVPDSRQASTVVSAIIDLAHRLSIRVCAEGVETEQAFEFLKDAGCDSLQGVLFAPPMPARDLEQFSKQEPTAAVAALRDGSTG